jgi:hypothetical protein
MKSMKSMMVAALVVGSLFACSTATFAQAGGGGRRGAITSDAMIARFQTALGDANKLTDAELPKVKAALVTDDQFKIIQPLLQRVGGRRGGGGVAPAPAPAPAA